MKLSIAALFIVFQIISAYAAPGINQQTVPSTQSVNNSYIVTLDTSNPETSYLFNGIHTKSKHMDHSAKEKNDFAANMGINGTVNHIYPGIKAVNINMDALEADLLSQDNRVMSIERDRVVHSQGVESYPGWALDRIDANTPYLDNFYRWQADGTGRTIYLLDTGVNTSLAEFGGRAMSFWDVNDPQRKTSTWAQDCNGHGTAVADAAGGKEFGIAKGVKIISAKITTGCSDMSLLSTSILAFDWLAANAPAGTIVNWSISLSPPLLTSTTYDCSVPVISTSLESAMRNAYQKGIIIVVSAGNDACNTANYSPTRINEVFVTGATNYNLLGSGWDAKSVFSRNGWQIDLFAPGEYVPLYSNDGIAYYMSGTSFSAAYVSGLFAIGCQLYPDYCINPGRAFNGLKSIMTANTVINADGSFLGAPSLMIWQPW